MVVYKVSCLLPLCLPFSRAGDHFLGYSRNRGHFRYTRCFLLRMLLSPNLERTYMSVSPFSDASCVEKARSELDRDIEEGKEFIRSLKTRRNALAPISRLPSELLSEIFTIYAASHNSQDDFTCGTTIAWIGITQVCRHWRAVSSDCARMWANLVFTRNSATEDMILQSNLMSHFQRRGYLTT
jgi:hypothetical protein